MATERSGITRSVAVGGVLYALLGSVPGAWASDLSAAKQEMIRQSIASYDGNCPCPYNHARNGSSCGRRSAYSRSGGASPLCYETDIPDSMVAGRSVVSSPVRVEPQKSRAPSVPVVRTEWARASDWVILGVSRTQMAWIAPRGAQGDEGLEEVRIGGQSERLGSIISIGRDIEGWYVLTEHGPIRK